MQTTEQRSVGSIGTGRRRRLTRLETRALTRRRLLDAAAAVFGEKGFRAASLADIADWAGYTIGAVYSNFASKDELFQGLMAERLRAVEEGLAAAFSSDRVGREDSTASIDDRIEAELDRLGAAEDAVPAGWWRLLAEFRAYAATVPEAGEVLASTDRRCREIIALHIERFAADVGLTLPMPPIELAEISSALADGLRAAYAEGRSSISSGIGLRRFVRVILEVSARVPRSGSAD